jgi:hypothetical protein
MNALEFKEVLAARRRDSLSFRVTGVDMLVKISTAFSDAAWKPSAIVVGWSPIVNY